MAPALPASWKADETFWGQATDSQGNKINHLGGGSSHKMIVVSLVERNGEKRSFHVTSVNAASVGAILKRHVSPSARLMTDEAKIYKTPGQQFASHESVSHGRKEYARGDVTSNTVESSFAILKRGLYGTFHSVSEKHLQRYCTEFDFRWNTRSSQGVSDVARTAAVLSQIGGKRLTYRRIGGQQETHV